MAFYLLIDNSNSFTKFALSSAKRVGAVRRLPTPEVSIRSVKGLLKDWNFEAVILCSVVPAKGALLRKIFAKTFLLEVSASTDLGVGIDYPQPASIGADRLANAVAVALLYRPPAVVVDFGTAVTFDIISKERCYIGGVIAPGLEAMTDYLHQRTAKLPKISLLEPPGVIGKSTKHAMLAGAVYGYRGLVREILLKIRHALPGRRPLNVIATGGYAELIAADLPEITEVRPKLTLDGLRLIANRHFPKKDPQESSFSP
ncbi:MAG: type III pantothenate kinase [Verrucomicrobia bacterium]|nr:MAG: type III pantothenate kinase [Verrucomicrobiota bacterium]